MILAKRQDNSPVQRGDYVVARRADGAADKGVVTRVLGAVIFPGVSKVAIQTYAIRFRDGTTESVPAPRITHARPRSRRIRWGFNEDALAQQDEDELWFND